jgi:DNA-binding MarR family transcriptional regulator
LQFPRPPITQPLAEFQKNLERNEGMARVYLTGHHTMATLARYLGVHYSTVSRAMRNLEKCDVAMQDLALCCA